MASTRASVIRCRNQECKETIGFQENVKRFEVATCFTNIFMVAGACADVNSVRLVFVLVFKSK